MTANIIRTILELKGHALAGGTMLPVYAESITNDALEELNEIAKRYEELAKRDKELHKVIDNMFYDLSNQFEPGKDVEVIVGDLRKFMCEER